MTRIASLFDAPLPQLNAVEHAHLTGMATWLPRAFPSTPTDQMVRTMSLQQLRDYCETAKGVHLTAWMGRDVLEGKRVDVHDLLALARLSVNYLAPLPVESKVRQLVSLDVIQGVIPKLEERIAMEKRLREETLAAAREEL